MYAPEPDRYGDWVEQWLSAARFAPFLRAAGGSRSRALAVYEWNARLNAALSRDLGHLEIALRNGYDRALSGAVVSGDRHWTDVATSLQIFRSAAPTKEAEVSRPAAVSAVARARRALSPSTRADPPADEIVAELTFGFWSALTSDVYEQALWIPYLRHAFPPEADRARVHSSVTALRRIRNRVAHHEHVLSGAEGYRRRIVGMLRMLSPEVQAYVEAHSDVAEIIGQRP